MNNYWDRRREDEEKHDLKEDELKEEMKFQEELNKRRKKRTI